MRSGAVMLYALAACLLRLRSIYGVGGIKRKSALDGPPGKHVRLNSSPALRRSEKRDDAQVSQLTTDHESEAIGYSSAARSFWSLLPPNDMDRDFIDVYGHYFDKRTLRSGTSLNRNTVVNVLDPLSSEIHTRTIIRDNFCSTWSTDLFISKMPDGSYYCVWQNGREESDLMQKIDIVQKYLNEEDAQYALGYALMRAQIQFNTDMVESSTLHVMLPYDVNWTNHIDDYRSPYCMNRLSKYITPYVPRVKDRYTEVFSTRLPEPTRALYSFPFECRCKDLFRVSTSNGQLLTPLVAIQNSFCAVWPTDVYIHRRPSGKFSVVWRNSESNDHICINLSKESAKYTLEYALYKQQHQVTPEIIQDHTIHVPLSYFTNVSDKVDWSDMLVEKRFPSCITTAEEYTFWEFYHTANPAKIVLQKNYDDDSSYTMQFNTGEHDEMSEISWTELFVHKILDYLSSKKILKLPKHYKKQLASNIELVLNVAPDRKLPFMQIVHL
eukprot:Lankesteria_metandrocarpae@DN5259_c0_g3_i2.p1